MIRTDRILINAEIIFVCLAGGSLRRYCLLCRWKGKLLFVICKLKMFLADQEVDKYSKKTISRDDNRFVDDIFNQMARERITKQEFSSQLHKCITGLDEVINISNWEVAQPPLPPTRLSGASTSNQRGRLRAKLLQKQK